MSEYILSQSIYKTNFTKVLVLEGSQFLFNIEGLCIYKQKHPACKIVRGQSEAVLQTGKCNQKLCGQEVTSLELLE